MNELHQAYQVFQLPIGAPWETVKRRYKRLASVWHPDRAANEDARIDMEEDLKVINNAFDAFKKHFDGGQHTADAECRCQPSQQGETESTEHRTGPGPGPGPHRTRPQDGEHATEEAQTKAAEDLAYKTAMERLRRQQRMRNRDALLWSSTTACAVVFVLLCGLGSFGSRLKSWWYRAPSVSTRSDTDTTTGISTAIRTTPFKLRPTINPDPSPLKQEHEHMRQDEQLQQRKEQDIYLTKLEIDRHQKAIQQCEANITNIDIQLANPNLSYLERSRLEGLSSFRQRTLDREQAGLESAQTKVQAQEAAANSTMPQTQLPLDRLAITRLPISDRRSPSTPGPSDSRFGPPLDPDSLR